MMLKSGIIKAGSYHMFSEDKTASTLIADQGVTCPCVHILRSQIANKLMIKMLSGNYRHIREKRLRRK